jgi:hypothetical protein
MIRQSACARQIVERREQEPLGEVPSDAEYREHARIDLVCIYSRSVTRYPTHLLDDQGVPTEIAKSCDCNKATSSIGRMTSRLKIRQDADERAACTTLAALLWGG